MVTCNLAFTTKSGDVYMFYPSTVSLHMERTCTPATLTGTIPDVTGSPIEMGATCRFQVDGVTVFYGYVFQRSVDRYGAVSFTAYDCTRYLKNPFSAFYKRGYQPKQVISDMAYRYGLKLGYIEDIPAIGRSLMIDNESCFDVISKLVETASILNTKVYVFYAEDDKLNLRCAEDMITNAVIGENSLATDYTLSTSIDDDVYNEIALYRGSEHAGGRAYKTAKNAEDIAKWGHLVLMEASEDGMTTAQMQEKANRLLEMKDREFKSMNITALGIVGLRAGMMITLHFPTLQDPISKTQTVMIDSIDHTFEDNVHTMSLEVRTFWRDSPSDKIEVKPFLPKGAWEDY